MKIDEVLLGDQDAIAFINTILQAAHFFDDVADGDKPLTADDAERMAWAVLVELPRNPFYVRHYSRLAPFIEMAIRNWRVANQLEATGGDYELRIAYIIRSSYVDLIVQTASIAGGDMHALDVAHALRLSVHDEGWDNYLMNLAAQKGQ